MTTRREFLISSAGALGGLMVAHRAEAAEIKKIGLQLYTVRDELAKDFRGTLERVAGIGFREVEFAGYAGQTPEQVRAALTALKLEAPSTHVPLAAVRDRTAAVLDEAAAVGHRYVVVAWLSPEERGSADEYRKLAELFNRVGEEARKRNLQFAYHNHGFEFVEQNGRVPYDLVLRETDPKLVKLQIDLYWLSHDSKQPPRYWFERAPGRYVMWHVKDMHKVSRAYTELGNGSIDYTKIWPDAAFSGMQHFFVEQGGNFAQNSMQSVADCAAYVKRYLLPGGA